MNLKQFKKKALLPNDELFTILFISPITIRLAYFFYKNKWKITPNHITYSRMYILAPITILCLFLASLLEIREFYLIVPVLMYFIFFTDELDGDLARGSNQKSEFGAFLDTISDRVMILLFFIFLFSLGLYTSNFILVFGSILLFYLKDLNLTIINKIYYYKKNLSNEQLFSSEKEVRQLGLEGMRRISYNLLKKIIKHKRYGGNLGGVERMVLMVILPSLLVFFNLTNLAVWMSYIYLVLFSWFYISRTIGIIQSIKDIQ